MKSFVTANQFKRELRRLLRSQEARCYEAIEKAERAHKLIDSPRLLSSARVQAVRSTCRCRARSLGAAKLLAGVIRLAVANQLTRSESFRQSEHRVLIGRCCGNHLQHVPVFGNFAVFVEAENVNSRPILIARPFLKAMQDDVIALGQRRFDRYQRAF